MSIETNNRPRPDTINSLAAGVYPALAMLAGMQLDIFTPLSERAHDASSLAEIIGVNPERLKPLLYALVTANLLAIENGRFVNTPEAQEYLVSGKKGYLGGQHETFSDLWAATMMTAESIRTGKPQAKHDFSAMSEESLRGFLKGLDAGASAAGRRLIKLYDMSRYDRLLDAGGGGGGLAKTLCSAYSNITATVADLPNVIEVTSKLLSGENYNNRLSTLACDFVKEPPPGTYDVAVLRSFLQVLSARDAALVLKNIGASLQPGGAIFIIGRVLNDDHLGPKETVAANVMFLNIYDCGQAYTIQKHHTWLQQASFVNIEKHSLSGGYSIIKAEKRQKIR